MPFDFVTQAYLQSINNIGPFTVLGLTVDPLQMSSIDRLVAHIEKSLPQFLALSLGIEIAALSSGIDTWVAAYTAPGATASAVRTGEAMAIRAERALFIYGAYLGGLQSTIATPQMAFRSIVECIPMETLILEDNRKAGDAQVGG